MLAKYKLWQTERMTTSTERRKRKPFTEKRDIFDIYSKKINEHNVHELFVSKIGMSFEKTVFNFK